MTHASLFSGIGGFDLAAERAGWKNMFNCEVDPFCQRVLKYHFPHAEQYSDIRTTAFTVWRGRIDILTGGFPCQPFSLAGKRKGTDDERHLWPEMLRAIREIRPRWVVGENVFGILNWSGGLVFEQVCADLEIEGYQVQPFILPAAGVGAPHKRDRVWFVAHRSDTGIKSLQEPQDGIYAVGNIADASKSKSQRHKQYRGLGTTRTIKNDGRQSLRPICSPWEEFPSQPPICGRDDGFSDRLDRDAVFEGVEESKRKHKSTLSRWRAESIKAYGNAIVPQVAYQIFETINKYEAATAV